MPLPVSGVARRLLRTGFRATRFSLISVALGCAVLQPAPGMASPEYRHPVAVIPYAAAKPVIDGTVDDAEWQRAFPIAPGLKKDVMDVWSLERLRAGLSTQWGVPCSVMHPYLGKDFPLLQQFGQVQAGWQRPSKLLLLVANFGEAQTAQVAFDLDKLGWKAATLAVSDPEQGQSLIVAGQDGPVTITYDAPAPRIDGTKLTVPVERHNFRLLVVKRSP